MTRLTTRDICDIGSRLEIYNQALRAKTGRGLLGIACHAYARDEKKIQALISDFTIHVVPITSGLGIISDFSQTVAAILRFLGFDALVSEKSDTSGVAQVFERKACSLMMADDHRFVGINVKTGQVADNSRATGRVFAAALDLMARGIKGQTVLVQGCGPVGESAAKTLLSLGAGVALYDIHVPTARLLREKLLKGSGKNKGQSILVEDKKNVSSHRFILDATPCGQSIPDNVIGEDLMVAAPGVPLGISKIGCLGLKNRLVHDKLELGVAAMAVSLLPWKRDRRLH